MTGTIVVSNFPMRDRLNDRVVRELQYTGPAAYVAGGDPIGPDDIGIGTDIYGVYGVLSNNNNAAATAVLIVVWDYVNQKLQLFTPNTGAEASGNVSTYSGTLLFHGKG